MIHWFGCCEYEFHYGITSNLDSSYFRNMKFYISQYEIKISYAVFSDKVFSVLPIAGHGFILNEEIDRFDYHIQKKYFRVKLLGSSKDILKLKLKK